MSVSVCPAAVVAAPVEMVWANLVQWERFEEWADVRVELREPEGPASAGQTVILRGNILVRTPSFTFKIHQVDAERHQISAHVTFPFGLQQESRIVCQPIDANTCRVQYG